MADRLAHMRMRAKEHYERQRAAGSVKVCSTLPASLIERLDSARPALGFRTRAALVEAAVEEYLDRHQTEK
jgi:metal-responsive CopG/Arc/MetJ family transcriptional regulator